VAQPNVQFSGSIPEHYDHHLGPVLFAPYAADMAARVAADVRSGTVLELACGTGIVTRQLRAGLAPAVRLVATDLSDAMVRYAQAKVQEPGIEWRQADTMALPFDAGFAAAIVCQFGLMFVPDKPRAVREMHRVLQPDGRIWLSVWDSLAANPAAYAAHGAVANLLQTPSVPFFHIPHGLYDTDALLQLFEENGFTDVRIELVALDAVGETADSVARGFVYGTPLSLALAERGADPARIAAGVADALRDEGGDSPFRSTSRAWMINARRENE
jgi:SAM-dependent methyltransferase